MFTATVIILIVSASRGSTGSDKLLVIIVLLHAEGHTDDHRFPVTSHLLTSLMGCGNEILAIETISRGLSTVSTSNLDLPPGQKLKMG